MLCTKVMEKKKCTRLKTLNQDLQVLCVYMRFPTCHCCPSRCINAILSHQTISVPTTAAVEALEERQVADLQLAETLHLQMPLKHHLTVQTAYCGSGVSKRMIRWRERRRRVEQRAPVILSGSDVHFCWSKCASKESKLCFYSLSVGRSSHFLSLEKKSSGKPCLLLFWHRKAIICSPGQPSDVLVWFLIFIPYDSTYSSVYSALRGSR